MREKVVSYRITVTPPMPDVLKAGRRRRAKACELKVVEDLESAQQRLEATLHEKALLESEIQKLQLELNDKQKSLEVAEREEQWLITRVGLRKEQHKLLTRRLTSGWDDETIEA